MRTAPFRRIITAHDSEGKAIIMDNPPAPRVIDSGASMPLVYELWNMPQIPVAVERNPVEPEEPATLPPPLNGVRARIIDFPPDREADEDAVKAHFEAMSGGDAMDEGGDAPHHFMHRTQSIDVAIVLQGEIVLIVDKGETLVKQGDAIIQVGTNHAWSNRTDDICRMAFFMVDGRFAPDIA